MAQAYTNTPQFQMCNVYICVCICIAMHQWFFSIVSSIQMYIYWLLLAYWASARLANATLVWVSCSVVVSFFWRVFSSNVAWNKQMHNKYTILTTRDTLAVVRRSCATRWQKTPLYVCILRRFDFIQKQNRANRFSVVFAFEVPIYIGVLVNLWRRWCWAVAACLNNII